MAKPNMDELMHSDFSKWFHPEISFCAMRGLDSFRAKHKRAPKPWHAADAEELVEMALKHRAAYEGTFHGDTDNEWKALVRKVAWTAAGELSVGTPPPYSKSRYTFKIPGTEAFLGLVSLFESLYA